MAKPRNPSGMPSPELLRDLQYAPSLDQKTYLFRYSLVLSEWVGAECMVDIARNGLTAPKSTGIFFVRQAASHG